MEGNSGLGKQVRFERLRVVARDWAEGRRVPVVYRESSGFSIAFNTLADAKDKKEHDGVLTIIPNLHSVQELACPDSRPALNCKNYEVVQKVVEYAKEFGMK